MSESSNEVTLIEKATLERDFSHLVPPFNEQPLRALDTPLADVLTYGDMELCAEDAAQVSCVHASRCRQLAQRRFQTGSIVQKIASAQQPPGYSTLPQLGFSKLVEDLRQAAREREGPFRIFGVQLPQQQVRAHPQTPRS